MPSQNSGIEYSVSVVAGADPVERAAAVPGRADAEPDADDRATGSCEMPTQQQRRPDPVGDDRPRPAARNLNEMPRSPVKRVLDVRRGTARQSGLSSPNCAAAARSAPAATSRSAGVAASTGSPGSTRNRKKLKTTTKSRRAERRQRTLAERRTGTRARRRARPSARPSAWARRRGSTATVDVPRRLLPVVRRARRDAGHAGSRRQTQHHERRRPPARPTAPVAAADGRASGGRGDRRRCRGSCRCRTGTAASPSGPAAA